MDKLIYLFFLLILFLNSVNNKLLLPSICLYVGVCLYFRKKKELIIGLIVVYIFSIVYNKSVEKFQSQSTSSGTTQSGTTQSGTTQSGTTQSGTTQSGRTQSGRTQSGTSFSKDYKLQENDLVMKEQDYSELMYVFKSLLESDYLDNNISNIEDIISDYNILNIYDLGNVVLNKVNNKKYNNFLEKITCIDSNGNINYLDTDNINYKKLYAFSELIEVYTFSKDKVIELINVYNIYKLCDLDKQNKILIENGKYGYEYNGLLVYLNVIKINNSYYKLLELLELDKLLNNKNIEIPIKERLYNYVDTNKKISKDLNSLLVLFDYYKILDDTRINNEEDDFELDYSLLRNINLNENYWDYNPYFKMYNIKEKIINKINSLTEDDKNIFEHKLNDKFLPTTNVEDRKEYKVFKNDSSKSNDFLESFNLKMIKNRFVDVFIDIINDYSKLYNSRCSIDCENSSNIMFDKLMYYLDNIIKIMIKEGRMFYVGIFVIFISFVLYFIEVSK
jgi:hypothetical protein